MYFFTIVSYQHRTYYVDVAITNITNIVATNTDVTSLMFTISHLEISVLTSRKSMKVQYKQMSPQEAPPPVTRKMLYRIPSLRESVF